MPSDARRAVRDVAVVLGCFAVAGLACGLLWYWWWAPAPEGFVYDGAPYFPQDADFRGTGLYVGLAAPVGAVLGVLLTRLLRHDEVRAVVAVVLGGALAGGVMGLVGWALGPESAEEAAREQDDWSTVQADLTVEPYAAWFAFPAGAAAGSLVVLLGTAPGRHDESRRVQAFPG